LGRGNLPPRHPERGRRPSRRIWPSKFDTCPPPADSIFTSSRPPLARRLPARRLPAAEAQRKSAIPLPDLAALPAAGKSKENSSELLPIIIF